MEYTRKGVFTQQRRLNMGVQWITILLLATSWTIVTSEYNEEICKVIKESYGLVPPPIPNDFEARREYVDYGSKTIVYEETYFDFTNSRAKHVILTNGLEKHFLLDYKNQQVITYDRLHPYDEFKKDPLSHVCTTLDIEEFTSDFSDNTGRGISMRPSTYELEFGGKTKYAFNGTDRMQGRGILVDKFIGCVYQETLDATMNISYLFTSKANLGVGTAAGTYEKTVTGIENGFLSVPVKADIYGSSYNYDTEETLYFNRTVNFFWFKGEPEFKLDTFKIPPYLYCEDFRGQKEMPKFPTAFSTRVQRTQLSTDILGKAATSEITSFENIVYYQEKKLARRDYTPGPVDTEIKSAFETMSPVRTIYDFSEGLLYTSNIASGRCFIRPITHADYMEANDEGNLYINMATPEHLFLMENDKMEYKGKDFTRDIECDVWAGLYKDKNLNATYVKETYISTNGWHELVDDKEEFGVPVKHTIIQKELFGELSEGVTAFSFLKFKAKPPLLREFDVSNCIETQNHKDFAIFLSVSDATEKIIFQFKYQFLDAVQYYINNAAQLLSPLRVQRLQFRKLSMNRNLPVILFTLVDKIKLKAKVPVGQRGASLDEAIANLQKFVDTNQFAIKFVPPNSLESVLVPAFKGNLYVRKSSGDLTYYVPAEEIIQPSPTRSKEEPDQNDLQPERPEMKEAMPNIMHDDHADLNDVDQDGMTPGSLALLSFAMLFIGIGVGVCIMYLYLRYKTESNLEDRIQLSLKTSEDGTRDVAFAEEAH